MTDISVTDEELRTEIAKILKDADLHSTSTKKVIKKLEETFKTTLTRKKSVIDKMVLDYINSLPSEEESDNEQPKDEEEEPKDEEEEPKDEEEDDGESKAKKPKKAAKAKKAPAKGGRRGKGSGYTRAYKLSPALAELMGENEMSRHEVVKRMWAIIKEKKMYDPNNKQFAICDDALYKVIGTKRFRTFGMMKYLKNHFIDD